MKCREKESVLSVFLKTSTSLYVMALLSSRKGKQTEFLIPAD